MIDDYDRVYSDVTQPDLYGKRYLLHCLCHIAFCKILETQTASNANKSSWMGRSVLARVAYILALLV